MPRPTMGTRTIRLKPDSTIGAVTALLLTSGMAFAQGGPYERQRVDNAAADRGRAVYAKHCINCHGSTAKGHRPRPGPDSIDRRASRSARQRHRPGTARRDRTRRR